MKNAIQFKYPALPPEAPHISMNACLRCFQALKSSNWIGDVAAENGILGPDSLDKLLLPSGPRRVSSQRRPEMQIQQAEQEKEINGLLL